GGGHGPGEPSKQKAPPRTGPDSSLEFLICGRGRFLPSPQTNSGRAKGFPIRENRGVKPFRRLDGSGNGNARRIYGNVHLIRALPAPALAVQREVNDEARSDRYCKRGHFGCDRWGGDGECTVLSPLRPCSNLYLASLYPPKPRLGSPRGRSAHCSVFRPAQSGSHRWW